MLQDVPNYMDLIKHIKKTNKCIIVEKPSPQ